MRIGLISDVHANLPALEAVLAGMPANDLIICAGDIVGYYADVNEVCERVRQLGAHTIRGNHDAYVTGKMEPKAESRLAYRTDWTREQLTPTNLDWLDSLPAELVFRWGGTTVRVRHASPWDEETYLYPDSPRLNDVQVPANELWIIGHTHRPMQRRCGEGWLINPGSVGQPRDWNPMASYAVLNTETGNVEFHRVCYDVAGLQARLAAQGWDRKMLEVLSRTRIM